jgi:hypothetical protein
MSLLMRIIIIIIIIITEVVVVVEARGNVVEWGTVLQAGKSRLRFPMRSLDF